MDDLARELLPPLNGRKRKQDADECNNPSSPPSSPKSILVDTSAPSTLNAPRQSSASWFPSPTDTQPWPPSPADASPPPPQPKPKRPRIEILPPHPASSAPRRSPRNHPASAFARGSPSRRRRPRVSAVYPRPRSDLPLTPTDSQPTTPLTSLSAFPSGLPFIPVDPNSPHIPSLHPLINRQTLKELDLDAILRNPQLRHDLLFDSGLQFRPTTGRRKRELSENYWLAVVRELETGCTCVSFDLAGKPHALACSCQQVALPSSNPVLAFSSSIGVITLRMPSRIRPLLCEFLEVLLSVIQPLSSISGIYVHPSTFQSQMRQHSAQAAHLRSAFDPDLIHQELSRNIFDPSGLFRTIGGILKSHCAPMRDAAVNAFVELAQTCAPGGKGTKADAVGAVRMCLEILELMKLDIANHQLQTLRPFLVRSSGQFELKAFRGRKGHTPPLQVTQQWLQSAHRDMLISGQSIPHPSRLSSPINYLKLQRNQQIYLSVLKGLTDLVFTPPSHTQSPTSPSTPPATPVSPSCIAPLPGYPETTYLDNARLALLSKDAAEATAIYMFLMLYRQLVFSDPATHRPSPEAHAIEQPELLQLKKEIRDIGTSYLGFCSTCWCLEVGKGVGVQTADGKEWSRWREVKQDVVLQVASRAKDRKSRSAEAESHCASRAPDERLLKLAERWAETNMQPGSALSVLLRNRLRDVVFHSVVAATHPARDTSSARLAGIDFGSPGFVSPTWTGPASLGSGMEPLADEIRSLVERLSRLALIHLNAYLPLYEQDGILDSS